jgi:hypothetical protein
MLIKIFCFVFFVSCFFTGEMKECKLEAISNVRAGYAFYLKAERKRLSGYASEREKVIYSVTTLQVYKARGRSGGFSFSFPFSALKKKHSLEQDHSFLVGLPRWRSHGMCMRGCWISLAMIDQLRCLKIRMDYTSSAICRYAFVHRTCSNSEI